MGELKQKVVSGLFWRMLERFSRQGAGFVVQVVLARLLDPKDFGTITLISVFIAVANVFIDAGFGTALVQSQDVTEEECDSVFFLSLAVSSAMYVLLWFGAPWVADYYQDPVLTPILRWLSLGVLIGALNTVQYAMLTRSMNFRLSFGLSLVSVGVAGVVGIAMAYAGYGVWALAISTIAAQVANLAVLWIVVPWRPRLRFSTAAVRRLFGFGSNLLASNLLDTVFNNLYNIIIGKLFNQTVLGLYSRGQSIPNTLMSSVQGTLGSVIFPALASCQQDRPLMKKIVRRAITTSCFLVFPMMFGLAAVAQPLVLLLLTAKWLPCVPYLQLACITFAFWPLHVANLQAITAAGRSDIYLKLEIVKKVLVVVIIVVTFRFGVMAMVIGQAVGGLICVVINAWPNRRLLDYPLRQQVADVLPAFLLAGGMGFLIWGLRWLPLAPLVLLPIQMAAGVGLYFGAARALQFESGAYFWRQAHELAGPRLQRLARVFRT